MSEKTETFVRALVDRFPSLQPLFDEHVADNFGELLPHVFFGDIVRWVLSLLATAKFRPESTSGRRLTAVLQLLEETYSGGDGELQELLSVSFLENLPRPGEVGAEIRDQLGPSLTRQLKVIG